MKKVKIAIFYVPKIGAFEAHDSLQQWTDDAIDNELAYMDGWKRLTEWVEVELPLMDIKHDI